MVCRLRIDEFLPSSKRLTLNSRPRKFSFEFTSSNFRFITFALTVKI